MPAAVRVLATTAGNEFMLDIAGAVVAGMRQAGAACRLALDEDPEPASPDLQLVVAPHEYFPLHLERRLDGAAFDAAVAATHVLNVEQPGGPWFERAWLYARHGRGVFDIDREGAAEFRRRGIDAIYTPLGATSPPPANVPAPADRGIDLLFLGHASSRRARFFADHAPAFARRRCRVVFADVERPRRSDTPGYVSGDERAALLLDSRVLLNVHASNRPYFERHRALLAFTYGCAFVSESSGRIAPLTDGQELVTAPLHRLADVALRLLDDPVRLAAIAAAGREAAHAPTMLESCRSMLARHACRSDVTVADDDRRRHDVQSRLAASGAARASGRPDWTVHDNAVWTATPGARISVVVTVHDYRRFLDDCLASVCASDPVPGGVEIVVVDDGSTDGSAAHACAFADAAALPMRVVAKDANTGLADARNVGIALARGACLLTLDADNWIYPACLRQLLEALDGDRVAAAYPILRRFNDETGAPDGLVSMYAWSPRELVRGPYIDALALFRREALREVGGYSTDLIHYGWFGWEDYDLWLKLAQAGYMCRQVPAVLASYRVHERSMLARTNRTTPAIARRLAEKFAPLAAAHPGMDRYFGFPAQGSPDELPLSAASADEAQLAARCRDLEREVRAFETSWSWRVTAPLRFLYRRLGLAGRQRASPR